MKLLNWLNDTFNVSSIFDRSYHAVSSTVIDVMPTLSQVWSGFSQVLNVNTPVSLLFSEAKEKTRHVLKQSYTANILLYMAPVILYEAVFKRLLRSLVPTMEDSYTESAIDMMAWCYFIQQSMRFFIDNGIYNKCMDKATSLESQNTKKMELKEDCKPEHAEQANLMSPYNHFRNVAVAEAASLIPFIGSPISIALNYKDYAERLLEYNLSDLCQKHRDELLSKNLFYVAGFGLSFFATIEAWRAIIRHTTGVDNYFIYDALFYLVFQYYIVVSRSIDQPLPGKEDIDYVQYGRSALRAAKYLDERFHLLESVIERDAVQLYVKMHQDKINEFFESIISWRNNTWVQYVPQQLIPEAKRIILGIITDKQLNGFFENVLYLVKHHVKLIKPTVHFEGKVFSQTYQLIDDYEPKMIAEQKQEAKGNDNVQKAPKKPDFTMPTIYEDWAEVKQNDDNEKHKSILPNSLFSTKSSKPVPEEATLPQRLIQHK